MIIQGDQDVVVESATLGLAEGDTAGVVVGVGVMVGVGVGVRVSVVLVELGCVIGRPFSSTGLKGTGVIEGFSVGAGGGGGN
jgi:hypothetical protein